MIQLILYLYDILTGLVHVMVTWQNLRSMIIHLGMVMSSTSRGLTPGSHATTLVRELLVTATLQGWQAVVGMLLGVLDSMPAPPLPGGAGVESRISPLHLAVATRQHAIVDLIVRAKSVAAQVHADPAPSAPCTPTIQRSDGHVTLPNAQIQQLVAHASAMRCFVQGANCCITQFNMVY